MEEEIKLEIIITIVSLITIILLVGIQNHNYASENAKLKYENLGLIQQTIICDGKNIRMLNAKIQYQDYLINELYTQLNINNTLN